MKFNSGQSKQDFLDDLQRVTTEESPNLASLPSLFPFREFKNLNPFYGIISKDSFHLSVKDGASNPLLALDGTISKIDSGIEMRTKFNFLILPSIFLFPAIIGFFVVGIALSIMTLRLEPTLSTLFAIFIAYRVSNNVKKEKKELIARFLANTSANQC